MKLEVLVSTVNAKPRDLIKKMKINSNAIIINQCDKHSYEEIKHGKYLIKVYCFNERGIGLSRNSALMRATGDIVLFADDDEILTDDYEKKIVEEFENNKKADMVVFNIDGKSENRKIAKIKRNAKVYKHNCLKYGAVRFAVKLSSIKKKNILFSLLFGGGCKYGSGEDSIFIYECLKKKMKVYSSIKTIAFLDFSNSTWFSGYNNKFFYDKGALFYSLHGKYAYIFMMIFLIRHKYMYKSIGIMQAFKCMVTGYDEIKNC